MQTGTPEEGKQPGPHLFHAYRMGTYSAIRLLKTHHMGEMI